MSAHCRLSQQELIDLVAGVEDGDPEADKLLYQIVRRTCVYKLVRNLGPALFEDRLNDSYVAVLTGLRRKMLREPVRLPGFIRRIADRQMYGAFDEMTLAKEHELPMTTHDISHWSPFFADKNIASNPGRAQQHGEMMALMERALGDLKPRHAEILVRFYLREETAKDIQQDMGLTETQFRLTKSRAKQQLGVIGKKYMNAHLSLVKA